MAFDEGIEEVVSLLTSYFLDGGRELVSNFGDQAPSLAAEMGAMLEERLTTDTPFGQMWEEYKRSPMENEAELIGALEVIEEADPELTIRLEGYYAAFQALDQEGVTEVIETSEPEETIQIEEITHIKSEDDFDDDDEYNEDNAYLRGNTEDHSTSAMYYEGQDTSIEPNQTEEE